MTSQKSSQNHYDTLGVDPTADPETIKRAYRSRARASHPDKGGDPNTMIQINHAYDILSDPSRRAFYDLTGADQEPDIDKEARGMLMQFISDGLMRDVADLLSHARGLIELNLTEISNQKKLNQKARGRLEARRSKITRKSKDKGRGRNRGNSKDKNKNLDDINDQNIFHLLIDQQIKHIDAGLEVNARGQEVMRRGMEMLEEYKSSEKPEDVPGGFIFSTTSSSTGW